MVSVNVSYGQALFLSQHLQNIESNSEFVFNYDVQVADTLVLDYDFSNDFSLKNIKEFFYNSPIDIKVDAQQIILLPLEKKNFIICGTIRSSVDEEAFPYATLVLSKLQGIQSDEKGKFEYEFEAFKNEFIQFRYLGYESKELMVQELLNCPDIFLELDKELISKEIIIRDYLSQGISEGHSYGSFEMNLKQILRENEIVEQDIFRKVQLLPGIYSSDDSATNLNIRGSSADQNLISWEGVSLYDKGHFFGMISSVNPFHLKELRVYKSVHNPSFDHRVGGVIEMNLPDRVGSDVQVSIGSNLTEAHGNISFPFLKNKARIILAGRRSLFDILEENPTLESYKSKVFQGSRINELEESEGIEESEEQEISLSYGDANAKLIIEPNDQWCFQSSFLYSFDEFDYTTILTSEGYESSDTLSSNTLAFSNKLIYNHESGDLTKFNVGYSQFNSMNYFQFVDLTTANDFLEEELNNQISDLQIGIQHTKGLNRHQLLFGYTYDQKRLQNYYFEQSAFEYSKNFEDNTLGKFHHVYLNDAVSFDKLKIEFGGRISYAQALSNVKFSPRFSARYKIGSHLKLKSSGGVFYQYLRQLYETGVGDLGLNNAFWTLTDSDEESILSARKITLGIVFQKNNWLLDFESYFHHTTGISAENPAVQNQFEFDDMGELLSSGLDILVSKKINNFKSSLYYSLSDQSIYFPYYLEDDEEFFPANTDQRHVLNWTNSINLANWSFVASYQYRTGLPYSLPQEVLEIEEDEDEAFYEVDFEEINDQRLEDYHRIDFALNYLYQWREYKLTAGLSLINTLNRQNIQSRHYVLANYDESTVKPELLPIEKHLLPRTFLFHFRIYL